MCGGQDAPVPRKRDGGVKFTGAQGGGVGHQLFLKPEVAHKRMVFAVVFIKAGIKRFIAFAADGQKDPPLGGYGHIPHGVMAGLLVGKHVMNARLRDQVKEFLRLRLHDGIGMVHGISPFLVVTSIVPQRRAFRLTDRREKLPETTIFFKCMDFFTPLCYNEGKEGR